MSKEQDPHEKLVEIGKSVLMIMLGAFIDDCADDTYLVSDLFTNDKGDFVVKLTKNYADLKVNREYDFRRKDGKEE